MFLEFWAFSLCGNHFKHPSISRGGNVPPTLVTWRRAPHPFPSHVPRNGQKWEKERLPNFGRGREADGTTESTLGDVTVPTAPLSLSFIYLSFYFGFNLFFFFHPPFFYYSVRK